MVHSSCSLILFTHLREQFGGPAAVVGLSFMNTAKGPNSR